MATMVATPVRSLDQRRDALRKANRIRSYRAGLKRDVAAGRRRVVEVLDDPMLDSMRVWELLEAQRGVGRTKVSRVFRHLAMSPSKTVGGMSQRQRLELVAYLRGA